MDENFIHFENVRKDYKAGEVTVTALHDVSFSIGRAEICVIVGESGAGKTTLLNILGGDRFGNREGLLPDAPGRSWTECDVNTLGASSRGAERIVFSNDGLIYYTGDHYETFELLYGTP